MAGQKQLCAYCAQIDFSILERPSRAQLAALNKGDPPPNGYPFGYPLVKYEEGSTYNPYWTLGLQSRIDQEQSCPLCDATRRVLLQHPRVTASWGAHDARAAVCIARFDHRATVKPLPGVEWTGSYPYEVYNLTLHWIVPLADHDLSCPGLVPFAVARSKYQKFLALCLALFQIGEQVGPEESRNPFAVKHVKGTWDIELSQGWLSECLADHDQCEKPVISDDKNLKLFRFIDVQDEKVVEIRDSNLQSFWYAALSYVWGGPQTFCLRTDNILDLQMPGSLHNTPNTIRDAMAVASRLGFTYIYVDAFCLIQDDDDDKREQLAIMGKIYANATVCIVAASGESAYSGLPGISAPRKPQIEVAIPGYNMKLLSSLQQFPTVQPSYISDYVWSKRGWTFQERLLSRRSLIFAEGQTLWSCGQSQNAEEAPHKTPLAERIYDLAIDSTPLLSRSHRKLKRFEPPPVSWLLVVENFATRNFSFAGDAHDALMGAINYFQEERHLTFLWAVERKGFALHLLWYRQGICRRRDCLTTLPQTSLKTRVPIPSWTWLGWSFGSIGLDLVDLTGVHKDIQPYVLKNSPLRLEEVDDKGTTRSETDGDELTLAEVAAEDARCAIHKLKQIPDDQYLIFRAEYATFRVKTRKPESQRSHHMGMYQRYIVDGMGNEVGTFRDDYEPSAAESAPAVCDLAKIVTVARPRNTHLEGGDRSTVLLLETCKRSSDGVSTRLGVAVMFEEYWLQAERRTELVVLN